MFNLVLKGNKFYMLKFRRHKSIFFKNEFQFFDSFIDLTPKTIKFNAETVFSSPVFELILSSCSIGYAEQVTLPIMIS